MVSLSPIVLFVYNRPWHTRQTVEALQKNELAQESELFIFSDGPKNKAAAEQVQEVRDYIHTINGFKRISIIKRERNWGLADSIIDGVTQVVNQYDRVIVLEDDLTTSPFFLKYMNDALEKYKDDNAVMQISGYMFPVKIKIDDDALFFPFITTWGWGTWKRAWDTFDTSFSKLEILKKDLCLKYVFNLKGSYNYFQMLSDKKHGKNDSWGILWYTTVFFNKGIVLFPAETLIFQIGFDGSGRHCGGNAIPQQELAVKPIRNFPEKAVVDEMIYTAFLRDFKAYQRRISRLNKIASVKKILRKIRIYFG